MVRYTRKVGDLQYTIEASTVRELIELKQALDPDVLTLKKDNHTEATINVLRQNGMFSGVTITS